MLATVGHVNFLMKFSYEENQPVVFICGRTHYAMLPAKILNTNLCFKKKIFIAHTFLYYYYVIYWRKKFISFYANICAFCGLLNKLSSSIYIGFSKTPRMIECGESIKFSFFTIFTVYIIYFYKQVFHLTTTRH